METGGNGCQKETTRQVLLAIPGHIHCLLVEMPDGEI